MRMDYAIGFLMRPLYAQITHLQKPERKVVPVKTRAELYGHEATELLRIISMYPGLSEKQLCRFYPGREDVTKNLLSHLCRQGRARQTDTGGYFPYGNDKAETDSGMVRAAWVLLDFIDKAEYHSSSDFLVSSWSDVLTPTRITRSFSSFKSIICLTVSSLKTRPLSVPSHRQDTLQYTLSASPLRFPNPRTAQKRQSC